MYDSFRRSATKSLNSSFGIAVPVTENYNLWSSSSTGSANTATSGSSRCWCSASSVFPSPDETLLTLVGYLLYRGKLHVAPAVAARPARLHLRDHAQLPARQNHRLLPSPPVWAEGARDSGQSESRPRLVQAVWRPYPHLRLLCARNPPSDGVRRRRLQAGIPSPLRPLPTPGRCYGPRRS